MATIMCPVDFSDESHEAFVRAAAIARGLECDLLLVHVEDTRLPRDLRRSDMEIAEDKLAHWQASGKHLGVREVATKLLSGVPADELIGLAREDASIEVIVLGTHGRTGLSRVFMGSVAERVAREAPCTVMVVRPRRNARQRDVA